MSIKKLVFRLTVFVVIISFATVTGCLGHDFYAIGLFIIANLILVLVVKDYIQTMSDDDDGL